MADKNISLWKVEEFLIDNLKELPMGNGKFKLKAECSLEELIEKLEKYIDEDKVVAETDLEKEIHLWMEENTCGGYCSANIRETAEHFFELGLKAQKGE